MLESQGLAPYLVLIEQVLGCVGHASSIVLDAEGMLRPLGGNESRVLYQTRPQRVGQVLHFSQNRRSLIAQHNLTDYVQKSGCCTGPVSG